MSGPFTATVLVIRQNTPMGVSLMMNIITDMTTSFRLSNSCLAWVAFSPHTRMPAPNSRAITMTCSILAFTKALHILEGKMFTMVSMKLEDWASYSRPVVSSTGKNPLNRLATTRPMTMATSVVHI